MDRAVPGVSHMAHQAMKLVEVIFLGILSEGSYDGENKSVVK